VTIDPDRLEADEADRVCLRQMAALAADFLEALKDAGLPDVVANQMVVDWHCQVISPDGVVWEEEE